jgi:HPt (histidine-containing phosphotransfer) domain-containing protein
VTPVSSPAAASAETLPAGPLAELVEAIGAETVIEAAELFHGSARVGVARILASLAGGGLAEAGRQAHSLKSSAALLGAEALSVAMTRIEHAAQQGDRAAAAAASQGLHDLAETSLAAIAAALAAWR